MSQAYEQALVKVQADDRAFQDGYELIETMDKLAQGYRDHGTPLDSLITSVRTYIVRQLGAVRCPDSIERMIQSKSSNGEIPPIVQKFNSWELREEPNVSREIPPLRAEEAQARDWIPTSGPCILGFAYSKGTAP